MFKKLTCLLLLLLSVSSLANEKKLNKETTVFNETFSWQAQMGFSINYADSIIEEIDQEKFLHYLNISLLFDVYYKGFFIQSNHRRADTQILGAELGYQLTVKDEWALDIIYKTYVPGFIAEDIIEGSDKEKPILEGLKERDFGNGIGLRYSRFFDDSIFSVDVATLAPFTDVNGWVIDAFYSHTVPYRNWDIYLNAGMTYYSQGVIDYYTGIDASEVSPLREKYQGEHALRGQLEIFVQHPISESWTFNAGLSQSLYTANIKKSPIVDQQGATRVMLGVLYVF
ncbi:MipA/OmpV family protein [Colwelliaceae bacterium 6441]